MPDKNVIGVHCCRPTDHICISVSVHPWAKSKQRKSIQNEAIILHSYIDMATIQNPMRACNAELNEKLHLVGISRPDDISGGLPF